MVSISVVLILYEGGLSLKLSELKKVGKVVVRLITVGAFVTWMVTTVIAYYLLQLSLPLSLLLGAILIVTGPTVIQPLLHSIRPKGASASILKWEGIVIDPIGAQPWVREIAKVLKSEGIVIVVFKNERAIDFSMGAGSLTVRLVKMPLSSFWVMVLLPMQLDSRMNSPMKGLRNFTVNLQFLYL